MTQEASKCTLRNMRIWTDEDANAASMLTRVWRWRIYALVLIAVVVVVAALISRF